MSALTGTLARARRTGFCLRAVAKKKEVTVYRRKQGTSQPEVITVNYDSIKKGEQKDMMLEPYDIVEVGKSKKSIGDIFLEFVTGVPNRIPIPIRPF